ncbi:hypothetical protein ISN44_As12g034340 [Arabidopsis suecica]|uniref:Uncharacterized protein n=1 Tax=Arabidopsis suecica TaxID=45249 RepID=A0A8T1YQX0_ARASU|nr:hypothetical protein ISN44_As12g034340 [Arabidopsis suecica]
MFSPSTSSSRVLPVAFYSGGSEKSFMDPAIGALDCEAVDCLRMVVPVLPEVSGMPPLREIHDWCLFAFLLSYAVWWRWCEGAQCWTTSVDLVLLVFVNLR